MDRAFRSLYEQTPTPAPGPLYFGARHRPGHHLWGPREQLYWDWDYAKADPAFPRAWLKLMDGGLLVNGRVPDVPTGRVAWTTGRVRGHAPWHAFVWWDRSVDHRGGSNSGLYVPGFECPDYLRALGAGLAAFPDVRDRQLSPLRPDEYRPYREK